MKTQRRVRKAGPARFVALTIVLAMIGWVQSAGAQLQFDYVTNNGTITITGWQTYGGAVAVAIPATIHGLPVTGIADYAFEDSGVSSVTIPNSVTNIGVDVFQLCGPLTAITVQAGNPNYSSANGVLFNKNQTTLIAFPGGLGGNYAIPSSVTNIGNHAFEFCWSVANVTTPHSVTIPNSVISIGDFAFANSGLTSVAIGSSVTSIGDHAFAGCFLTSVTIPNSVISTGASAFANSGLTNVTIGSSVISIGDSAFAGCFLTSVTIPNSVTSIGDSAFLDCGLTTVTIPNSVTNIGAAVFEDCRFLTAITVDAGNPTYSSTNGVLFDKNQTTLIDFPGGRGGSYTIPNSITNIEDYAFYGCGLTSVTIPNSVTSIRPYTFAVCGSLTNITIGNSVTNIGDYAFLWCNMASVTIPDGVTSIGNGAFDSCTSLGSVTIPDSVTSIGNDAFAGCSGLASVTIPDSVTSVGDGVFENCNNLASVTIGSGVNSIGKDAFLQCYGLTNVTIGNSVTSIGNYAFYECARLTSVTIPDSVTSIGGSSFADCSGLTSVTVGASVTNIGVDVFEDCTALTTITVDAGNPIYSSLNGVLFDKNQTTLIEFPAGLGGSYTIPDSVTGIGDSAFEFCFSLTNVTIGNNVTNIGAGVFGDCLVLTAITVDAGNPIYSSINGVLFDKNQTTLIEFPRGLGGGYIIPDGVTSIGNDAFYNCTRLASVTLPNSVTNIGNGAFSDCYGLTSVTIPKSVTSLGADVFYADSSLNVIFFKGNAPALAGVLDDYFWSDGWYFGGDPETVYYLSGASGWSSWSSWYGAVELGPAQIGGLGAPAGGNYFGFTLTGTDGQTSLIEASTDLVNWQVAGVVTFSGASANFTDPQWTNYPARFYRVW